MDDNSKLIIDKKIFDYYLPKELIAQEPLSVRSASRMLVLDRAAGKVSHSRFFEVANWLNAGDCIVLNDTKVMPARLMGVKQARGSNQSAGAIIEVLLLKRIGAEWEALVRPAKRIKLSDCVIFRDAEDEVILKARCTGVSGGGLRRFQMEFDGIFEEVLDKLGETPLPPYITKKLEDKSRYQTVYAKHAGSAAAPTAGLHFTDGLLSDIAAKGVNVAKVTLHVGLGTFRPIKENNILEHEMHSEYFRLDAENAAIINETRRNGGRVICVGTTVVRTLEAAALSCGVSETGGELSEIEGETDIFIYPGFRFLITDSIITNFHLPESTLMALVSAFAGTENIIQAYNEAVENRYRFFSFGDCMFIISSP